MKKRILPLLLTLALILTLAPTAFITARAEEWTVIYSFDFESDPFSNGWTSEDLDGDGYGWIYADDAGSFLNDPEPLYKSPEGSVYSESYSNTTFQSLQPDNLLWSPAIDIPATGKTWVGLAVRGSDPTDYDENFRIGYALPGDTAMTPMSAEHTTENCWISHGFLVDSKLKGQTVRFCIEHYDTSGKFRLYLDDFDVTNYPQDDAEEYDLWICGERVTGTSLSGEGYSYDPESNTLTVFGDVKSDDDVAIRSDIEGLTILAGLDCTVSTDGECPAILISEDTQMTGVGTLTVECSTDKPAIRVEWGAALTIFDASVVARSADGDYAIYATNSISTLNIMLADVTAEACVSAVHGFYDRVLLSAERLAEPKNGYIAGYDVYDVYGEPATRVRFAPMTYLEIGAMCVNDTGDNGTEGRLVSVFPPAPVMVAKGYPLPEGAFMTAGAYGEGYYYAYSFDGTYTDYYTLPIYGGSENGWVKTHDPTPYSILSTAFDDYTGSLYAVVSCVEMMGDRGFVKIDRATGAAELIKLFEPGVMVQAIAFGERGVCYGVDFYGDVFLIDTETGEFTYSFSTGIACGDRQGLVYDRESKALYWLQYFDADNNGLYAINPVDGRALYFGRIGNGMQAAGAYIVPENDTRNYAIRFDANGGKADKVMIFNDDADRTFPTATGKGEFLGWFTAPVGGERVEDCGVVTEDLVLYAHYDASTFMKGDMDKDGSITVADALAALRIAAKLAEETYEAILIGDIDGDDVITVSDALKILRVAAKLASQDSLA
ncbi:MAG: InlB B-repeat-containing protein [Clostridia bacterium]|nr:InlB B-repeat-containing protein [Clostridia bacterium]